MVRLSLSIAVLTALASFKSAGCADEPISREQLASLHALIKPKEREEIWTSIPWHTSLWEARERAAAEGKPILLWEMDGHPLGCT
jgi:hypothetical protein